MNKQKHTDALTLVIHKDSVTRICSMAASESRSDSKRIEADARLIAASAEMLAALQELSSGILNVERINKVASAISNATEPHDEQTTKKS